MKFPTTVAEVPDTITTGDVLSAHTKPHDANGVYVSRCIAVNTKTKQAQVYVEDTSKPARNGRHRILIVNGELQKRWVDASGWTLQWPNGFEAKL